MADLSLLHPRENPALFGHDDAEKTLIESVVSNRIPNAWLITGPKGIGKATLAYRFARFLFDYSDRGIVQGLFGESDIPSDMRISEDNPLFVRMISRSLGNLLVLEPNKEESKKEILVDEVRKAGHFLSRTASEGGWRIVIVDSADEMNRNAANALLKFLEEPPKNTVILLVSHCSGRLLPTIRSRCRFLNLKPLADKNVIQILENAIPDINKSDAEFAARLSAGSLGFAMEIYAKSGLALYEELIEILKTLPHLNITKLQEFGNHLSKKENLHKWRMFTYMFSYFLSDIVMQGVLHNDKKELIEGENSIKRFILEKYSVDHLVSLWKKTERIANESDWLNMDRKLSVMEMFGALRG